MSTVSLIKYAFVAGEISPTIYGRTDLEKYDLGVAKGRNWFVDYRGGLSTRPGQQFVDFVQFDGFPTRFFKFKYAPNVANTYVILFGQGYIRFIQDGAYVLEGVITGITGITNATPGVVTRNSHGLTAGDYVYITEVEGLSNINGRLFMVGTVTTNTFELKDPFNQNFTTVGLGLYTSGGEIRRVYTIASPYDVNDLASLKASQRRDYIRFTHQSYPVKNLVRTAHTNWAISNEVIGNSVARPDNLTGSADTSGAAQVGFVVTAIFNDGTESVSSDMLILEGIVDYANAAGSVSIEWDALDDAVYYNVYRTLILSKWNDGSKDVGGVSRAEQVGFVGTTFGPKFTDNNIIPDFTVAPPQHNNPFANGSIQQINITAQGAGYSKTDTVTCVGAGASGSGFLGQPVVNEDDKIIAVVIINGGNGYIDPVVVTFTSGGGTGATADATTSDISGNYPGVSVISQQRQVYAATANNPLTLFGSKPGLFSNMDTSSVSADDDAYQHDIESEEVAPITHLIDVRGGLLVISQSGIWLLRGATTQSTAITPTSALAEPESYRGCSDVTPIAIDSDLLYIEGKSPTVRLLSYSDITKAFEGQDMSILSNHLFSASNRIVRWDYAQNPHNLVVGVKHDGTVVSFTSVKEQDVFAWCPWDTTGAYKDVAVVYENDQDTIYWMVQRTINGRLTKFIEKSVSREFKRIEDAFCVDAGLSYSPNYPTGNLQVEAATGSGVVFTRISGTFNAGHIGRIIRMGRGKAIITDVIDTDRVTCDIQEEILDVVPETTIPRTAVEGDWTMDLPFSTVGGLWHLIGEEVQILGDGAVMTTQIVDENGSVTLDAPCTRAVVGKKFSSVMQTLPPTAQGATIENLRKHVVGISVRINESRGLKAGHRLDALYEMRERTDEPYGQTIRSQSGYNDVLMQADWDENGQTYIVQDLPLPATIIGLVSDVDLGDQERKPRGRR